MALKRLASLISPASRPTQRQLTIHRLYIKEIDLLILKHKPEAQTSTLTCTSRCLLEYALRWRLSGATFMPYLCPASEYQYLLEGSFYMCLVPQFLHPVPWFLWLLPKASPWSPGSRRQGELGSWVPWAVTI